MSYFAQVIDGVVQQVIAVEQDVLATGVFGDPSQWIQTSYNTYGGVHANGGTPLRKNYASIGFKYDAERDAFIPPKPYDSWILNEETCLWNPPTPHPQDGKTYVWVEHTKFWLEV